MNNFTWLQTVDKQSHGAYLRMPQEQMVGHSLRSSSDLNTVAQLSLGENVRTD